MFVNYSEKCYENYYNTELSLKKLGVQFSPSQELEKHLGCDSIVDFHNQFAKYTKKDLFGINEKITKRLDRIPSEMNFSAFIQFKRPEILSSTKNGAEKYYDGAFYRIKLEEEQQKTLLKIKKHLIDLDVFYSAPFIPDNNELFNIYQKKEIINRSIGLDISEVSSHKTICYDFDGKKVLGFSEPEDIKVLRFRDSATEYNYQYNHVELISSNKRSILGAESFSKLVHRISNGLFLAEPEDFYYYGENIEFKPIFNYEMYRDYPTLFSLIYINEALKYLGLSWFLGLDKEDVKR